MGVVSDGSYGIPKDIVYSFPVKISPDHKYEIVKGLAISDFSREKMDATAEELLQEKESCQSFLEWLAAPSQLWLLYNLKYCNHWNEYPPLRFLASSPKLKYLHCYSSGLTNFVVLKVNCTLTQLLVSVE